jgi:hypothetical protein
MQSVTLYRSVSNITTLSSIFFLEEILVDSSNNSNMDEIPENKDE